MNEPEGEPNYKKLISDGIAGYLPGAPSAAAMEISALRRTVPVQPGDWITCLRRTAGNETALFAVFLKDHKIDTVRRSVLVDKCENESYAPLNAAKQAGK